MKRRASWAVLLVTAAAMATGPAVHAARPPTSTASKVSVQLLVSGCRFTVTAKWSGLDVTHVNIGLLGTDRTTSRTESNAQSGVVTQNTATATWETAPSPMRNGFQGFAALFNGDPAEGAQAIAQVWTKKTTAACETPPPN